MIDLTPLEVRKKKGDFRRGMRGYDPQSVDDFLDVVADRLEQLVRENVAMHERLGRVEDQVNDYRERERALTEALVTAQEMREQMRQQIQREAELKRREAEADAENIRSEARQTLEREEEAIRRLRARQTQFLQSYRAFLERELSDLAAEMESLEIGRGNSAPANARAPRKRAPEASPQAPATSQAAAAPAPAPAPEEPVPVLEPEDIAPPTTAAGLAAVIADKIPDAFDIDAPIADAAPEPTLSGGGAPREKTFDELLNALPGFAGVADTKQVESPPADPDEEAELLADVRAEFDSAVADDDELPLLAPEPDDLLELVDDVADDEDSDGWMSTLLEGRSDNRSQ